MTYYSILKSLAEAATNASWYNGDIEADLRNVLGEDDHAFVLNASPAVVFELIAENDRLRAEMDFCKSGGVPIDCNGSGCETFWYECHETDHIPAAGNMVTGPVGQIDRWFCEGRDAADGAVCRYGAHTLAEHWWSRGYSYNQRLARAIVAEAQLNCDPDDFAIDHLNDCLEKIDAAMSQGEKSGG